jgi:hypothetical protein
MFESWYASQPTPESAALLERVCDATRAESQAAAERLVAIGELFVLRCRDSGEREDWAADAWQAVAAQVGAALRCGVGKGLSYLHYAMAMRQRLPQVGKAFQAGDIDYRSFQTIVFRTDLITDADALAKVDQRLALLVSRCSSLTRGRLSAVVDQVVANADPDAVRRAADAASDRFVDVIDHDAGMAWVTGNVVGAAGRAFDRRLEELAATVCEADPRTLRQRRADAVGALAAGADRLVCGCKSGECSAAAPTGASNVVIHVIAEQSSVDGAGIKPGALAGREGLIPADVVAELARTARLQPVIRPMDAPEVGYTPSPKLAEFVRCRDLTCRAPGCDRPAEFCDIDHSIPFGDGGVTHPSNLKCLCRLHHLLKTFWGWRDKQLPDGTVIWDLPGGQTYVTTPGSALLFPGLCAPTGQLPPVDLATAVRCGDKTAMMPLRKTTRAQNRAHYIGAERKRNRNNRQQHSKTSAFALHNADADEDPPPF